MEAVGYKKSLCAFIDILGYKSLVEEAEEKGNALEIITMLEELVSKVIKEYIDEEARKEAESDNYQYEIFSDSIIITISIDKSNKQEQFQKLLGLCLIVAGIQIQSLNYDILLRGAISSGNHYRSNNVMFSKALVNAYISEEKKAVYPRVIIDVGNDKELLISEEILYGMVECGLLLKEGEYYFIDYIGRVYSIFRYSEELLNWKLKMHKDKIEENLRIHTDNPRVLEKYAWLMNYHNYKLEAREKILEINKPLESMVRVKFEGAKPKHPTINFQDEDEDVSIVDLTTLKPGETISF